MRHRIHFLPLFIAAGLATSAAGCGDSVSVDGEPFPPEDLRGEALDGRVRLSWSDPGTQSLVVRFSPDEAPGNSAPAAEVAPGDSVGGGLAVYRGEEDTFEDLPPCTGQVYAVWTRSTSGRWSSEPATVRVDGIPGVLPPPPASLEAAVVDGRVDLAWSAPEPGSTVRVVRETDRAPGGPAAGQLVAEATSGAATDRFAELSPDVTQHYAAYACTPCGECESTGAHAEVTPTLMQALRGGGFVVFWRHGTDRVCQDQPQLGFATETKYPDWWARCDRNCPADGTGTATARQLSPEGYAQAEEIGRALKEREIPFDRTVSSEFCRCFETAEAMALSPIDTAPEVTNYVYLDLFPDRCEAARLVMRQPPSPGTNRAIVAHSFGECAGGPGPDLSLPLPAQAAVFRYEGAGDFRFIAKVGWDEWASLP